MDTLSCYNFWQSINNCTLQCLFFLLCIFNCFILNIGIAIMLKNFTLTDKLLFVSAFLSLIYSEVLFFNKEYFQAIFMGLWVPSILAFGIYLKLLQNKKNGWFYTLFCNIYLNLVLYCIELCCFWRLEFQKRSKQLVIIKSS